MPLVIFHTLDDFGESVVGLAPKTLLGADQWTDEFIPLGDRPFAFSIRHGTILDPGSIPFVATASIQRSMDSGVTWANVEQYSLPKEGSGQKTFANEQWRIGIDTGDYTGGEMVVEVKQ